MNIQRLTFILLIVLTPCGALMSQQAAGAIHFGAGAGLTVPNRNFSDKHNIGYLFQIVDELKLDDGLSIGGHLGLYRFPGGELTGVDEANNPVVYRYGDEDIYILTQGVRYHVDNFFVGIEAGGFVGENKPSEISLFPVVGFQAGGFQIDARYKVLGSFDWATLSVSFFVI